jgi:hypothetical protein
MGRGTNLLDEGQKAEIKDLYCGNFGSIRELAKIFKVNQGVIVWLVNYKNYREKQTVRSRNWKEENRAYWLFLQKIYYEKYYKISRKIISEKNKQSYWVDPEKVRKKMRDWYAKNKEKVRARYRIWYYNNLERARASRRKANKKYRLKLKWKEQQQKKI